MDPNDPKRTTPDLEGKTMKRFDKNVSQRRNTNTPVTLNKVIETSVGRWIVPKGIYPPKFTPPRLLLKQRNYFRRLPTGTPSVTTTLPVYLVPFVGPTRSLWVTWVVPRLGCQNLLSQDDERDRSRSTKPLSPSPYPLTTDQPCTVSEHF